LEAGLWEEIITITPVSATTTIPTSSLLYGVFMKAPVLKYCYALFYSRLKINGIGTGGRESNVFKWGLIC
jgi:hypothetical protein